MRSLIPPTANPLLESALHDKLRRRNPDIGNSLGELAPLALRLGLLQDTLNPRFHDPQIVVFTADHGLAVDAVQTAAGRQTHEIAHDLLHGALPLAVFARVQQIELSVVDCGLAENLPAHERLLMRKIAHGTRNARIGNAMTLAQAHAGIRAGMEIGESLRGNMLVCVGLGLGSQLSAALVLSRLADVPVRKLLHAGPLMSDERLAHLQLIALGAQGRHREVADPVEVLAALGGFEMAMMVGAMLTAASRRHLLMIDGMSACAALMVASRIAGPVTDYCLYARSHSHHGLSQALKLFDASAMLELGLESDDGMGAVLAWPLVRCAAAVLTEVADGEAPGPSQPAPLDGAAGAPDAATAELDALFPDGY